MVLPPLPGSRHAASQAKVESDPPPRPAGPATDEQFVLDLAQVAADKRRMTHNSAAQTATAAPSGPRKRGLATRRRILDAAVKQFSEHPFDDVQMVEVAGSAGVAHGLVFHHFGSKRQLYQEAVGEISRRLFDVGVPDSSLQPYEQLRSVIRTHYNLMSANEALLRGYARGTTAFVSDVEATAILEKDRAAVGRWALEILGFDPHSIALRATVNSAASAMFQLSLKWLEEGRTWDIETQLIDATVEIVVGGLRAASYLDPTLDIEGALKKLHR